MGRFTGVAKEGFAVQARSELGSNIGHGEAMDALRTAGIFSGPVTSIITGITTGVDPFTKKPIVDPGDPPLQKSIALLNYVWNMAAPPFLISNGFLSPMGALDKQYGGKLVQGVTGTTDKYGDPRSTVGQAVAGLVGVNVKGVDPEHSRASEMSGLRRDILEVKRRLRQRLADQSLSEAQRQSVIGDHTEEIRKRVQKLNEAAKNAVVPDFARPAAGLQSRLR